MEAQIGVIDSDTPKFGGNPEPVVLDEKKVESEHQSNFSQQIITSLSSSYESSKAKIKEIADPEKIQDLGNKTKAFIHQIEEGIKSKAEYCVDYGKESLEWGKTKSKETLLATVELGKDTLIKGAQKSKEKLWQGVETGKSTIYAGKDKLVEGLEYGRESLTNKVDDIKIKIKQNVGEKKQEIKDKAKAIKDTITNKVEYGKDTISDTIHKSYEKLEHISTESRDLSQKGVIYIKNQSAGLIQSIYGKISSTYSSLHTCLEDKQDLAEKEYGKEPEIENGEKEIKQQGEVKENFLEIAENQHEKEPEKDEEEHKYCENA